MTHFVHDYPFAKQYNSSASHLGSVSHGSRAAGPSTEELTRIFNSALVASRVADSRNPASELQELMESTAFSAIMNAVRQVAGAEGISEKQAAEQIICTFRKMDQIWAEYVFQEGVDRLRNQIGGR